MQYWWARAQHCTASRPSRHPGGSGAAAAARAAPWELRGAHRGSAAGTGRHGDGCPGNAAECAPTPPPRPPRSARPRHRPGPPAPRRRRRQWARRHRAPLKRATRGCPPVLGPRPEPVPVPVPGPEPRRERSWLSQEVSGQVKSPLGTERPSYEGRPRFPFLFRSFFYSLYDPGPVPFPIPFPLRSRSASAPSPAPSPSPSPAPVPLQYRSHSRSALLQSTPDSVPGLFLVPVPLSLQS